MLFKTKLILISLFILIANFSKAQSSKINGTIIDSTQKVDLSNTSISLINTKDSVLYTFTRTNETGYFNITKPKDGNYLVLITHPKYADYIDTVIILSNTINIGKFYIVTKRKAYETVIVRAKIAPIKIKGDTVIYTADSFKVKDGANVEDLLKKLPGIQVGKNGEIKAMGETVKKVLVDGEEFFGDDPGVAIKNLQANAVDKVEVFDKKSDQATFTGVDDGVKDKTINLKLKENKKNGYFGKLEIGGGLPNNYSNQAMVNAFKKKRKIAAYGIMSNAGQTNLDWQDNQNYGGSDNNMTINEDGDMFYNNNGDDFTSYLGGRNGIPQNWNGGAHYSNKFNNDKQSINFGYKYNKVNSESENNTFAKTFLPDSSWNNNNGSNSFTSKNRNQINSTIETKLDSFNTVKINFTADEQNSINNSKSYNEAYTSLSKINESQRKNSSTTKSKNLTSSVLWMHRFKKIARTFSLNISNTMNQNKSDGFLYSLNDFYKTGNLTKRDTIDQAKINFIESNNFNSRLSYTEPITKKLLVEFSYSFVQNNNDNNRQSLNKDGAGKYTSLATQFSNHYKLNTNVQTPGISIKYTHKKITLNTGTKISFNKFIQDDRNSTNDRNYIFTNFFPSASLNIKMKGNKNFRINYDGSGVAPSLNKLQPIQDNTNPFYIVVGNPELKQSFTHRVSGNFNMYNVLKEKNVYSYFNLSKQQNAYTNFSTIDSLGKTTSKTVNVNGNYSGNINFNYGFKIKKINLELSFGPNINFNTRNDFVNGIKNESKSLSYGLNFSVSKDVEDKWSFWSYTNVNKSNNKASINNISTSNFWYINSNIDLNIHLPWKLELNNELQLEVRQKDPRYPTNNALTLWNASLKKEIVKNIFDIKLSVNDILNQNRGYQRSFTSYTFTESYYNTLQRYWIATLAYKFNSQKTKTANNVK